MLTELTLLVHINVVIIDVLNFPYKLLCLSSTFPVILEDAVLAVIL
jgi:hypothetical protein